MSTAFNPQTDSQTKRVNQILEDLLRLCILDFANSWEDHILLVEFANNDNYQASIKMAPYKVLYRKKCSTPLAWSEIGSVQLIGSELAEETNKKIHLIQQRICSAQDR